MLSAVNAYHLMASRVLFAISRDGLFAKQAATVNKGGTPTLALFTGTLVAALFIYSDKLWKSNYSPRFFFAHTTFLHFVLFCSREPSRNGHIAPVLPLTLRWL